MTLTEQYTKAFAENCLLDPDSWFENDTPAEQLELLDSLVASQDVAQAMLLNGEVNWQHIGWWKDAYQTLEDWARHGHLIKVRLVAEWLLSTLPERLSDPDCSIILHKLSNGNFCSPFSGLACTWPQKTEFYLSRLKWQAVAISMDEEANIRATVQARIIARAGGKL